MRKWIQWGRLSLLASSGLLIASAQGCKEAENAANAAAEQCDLECAAEGIVEGNASISGIPSIDAFFGAVVSFNSAANKISGSIEAQLAKLRTSLELEANATPAQIVAKIKAKYELEGELKVVYKQPECAVSAEATIEATARCDVNVKPGSAKVECKGSCEVEASAEVDCGASAMVKCVGTAPALNCDGSCEGSCELTVAAACEGTCNGTCDGECSVENADGSCAGKCEGKCEGSCQLTAGGSCSGKCQGECTYTPPSGKCEASASVRCEAMANASVECKGRCDGEITPPEASAECEASAKAQAEVNIECTPPSVDVEYAFKASADADVRAEFQAFLVRFRGSMSVIASELARAKVVARAGAELVSTGRGAVQGAINELKADTSLKVVVGIGCAATELGKVQGAVGDATARLTGNINAATSLGTELTGS